MSLSYVQISNAKPQPKAYKMTDADALYLTVQPNGSKLWRMTAITTRSRPNRDNLPTDPIPRRRCPTIERTGAS